MIDKPLILYIPGLLPKPDAETHRDALLRCLLAGVRRLDPGVAEMIDEHPGCFDIVSWTYDFYGEHRDFELDAASVTDVIEQPGAHRLDIHEATSTIRRAARSASPYIGSTLRLIGMMMTASTRWCPE